MKLIDVFYSRIVEELDKFASKRGFKRLGGDAVWVGDVDGMVVKIGVDSSGWLRVVRISVPNTGCYREWVVEIEVYYSFVRGTVDTRYNIDICSHWFEEGKWIALIELAANVNEVVSEALVKAHKEVVA